MLLSKSTFKVEATRKNQSACPLISSGTFTHRSRSTGCPIVPQDRGTVLPTLNGVTAVDVCHAMILVKGAVGVIAHSQCHAQTRNPVSQILIQCHVSKEGTLVNLIIGSPRRLGHRVQFAGIGRCTTPLTYLILNRECHRGNTVNHIPKISLRRGR